MHAAIHARGRLLGSAVVAFVLMPWNVVAAPLRAGLLVAEGTRCRAFLTKVSYDDPGVDDAEFLELYVEPVTPSVPPPAGASVAADGGASLDGSAESSALTLGDCGLAALELVKGASGTCSTYRAIPLSETLVPSDGYVTFCATDSTLAGAPCDVTTAGHSALRAGWLQNGPADGLRFVATASVPAVEVSYEGSLECFATSAVSLVAETGQLPGWPVPTDDVNAFCGDRFILVASEDPPLRDGTQCPAPAAAPRSADGGVAPPVVVEPLADAGTPSDSWVPERAPVTPPRSAPVSHGGVVPDAGLVAIPKPASSVPPSVPSCAVAGRAIAHSQPVPPAAPMAGGLALALLGRRLTRQKRRKWRRPVLARLRRAGFSARCGSELPR